MSDLDTLKLGHPNCSRDVNTEGLSTYDGENLTD